MANPSVQMRKLMAEIQPGEYLGFISESTQEISEVMTMFIETGINRGDRCLLFVPAETSELVLEGINRTGVDVRSMIESGILVPLIDLEAIQGEGKFDANRFIQFIVDNSLKPGDLSYQALRVVIDVNHLLSGKATVSAFLNFLDRLEQKLYPHVKCVSLTHYSTAEMNPDIINCAIMTTPVMIRNGQIDRNFQRISARELRSKHHDELARVFRKWNLDNLRVFQERVVFLGDVLRSSSQPMLVWHGDGRVMTFNAAFCDLTGYSEDELAALKWDIELSPPEWQGTVENKIAELERTGTAQRFKKEYVCKDGTLKPVEMLIDRISGENDLVCYCAFVTDISELKHTIDILEQTENSLIRQVNYLNQLIDNMNELFYTYDKEACLTFVNRKVYEFLGYYPEEALGRYVLEFVPLEYHEWQKEYIFERLSRGESAVYETSLIAKDGTQRRVRISGSPIIENGEIKGGMGIAEDITERTTIEKSLEESVTLYSTIFANTGSATILIDDDRTIIQANDEMERLSGYKKVEVEGKIKWDIFIADEEQKQMMIAFHEQRRELINEGAPTTYEFKLRDAWDRIRDVLIKVDLIPGTKLSVASMQDITELRDTTKALQASQKMLKNQLDYLNTLVENMNEGCFTYNREGIITFVNKMATDYLGFSKEEMIGRMCVDFVESTHHDVAQQRLMRIFETGRARVYEMPLVRKDGKVILVKINSSPITEDDRIVGGLVLAEDITQRRQAERKVRESEKRLRFITDNMVDMIAQIDSEGVFEYISPSCMQVLGYSQEFMIGRNMMEFVHPDDLMAAVSAFERAIQEQGKATIECRYMHADGHYIWLWAIGNPVFNKHGVFTRGIIASRDITAQREAQDALHDAHKELECTLGELTVAEEELRRQYQELQKKEATITESERRFRTILESILLIAVMTDAGGYIKFCNNFLLELTGWKLDEILDKHYIDVFVHPGSRDKARKALFGIRDSGILATHGENTLVTRHGKARRIHWNATLLLDDEGKPSGVVAIGEDITERREAEKQIQYLTLHDKLTGLYNRVYFEEAMLRLEGSHTDVALIMCDVDGLKLVNDSLGHEAGDALLNDTAKLVSRFGKGDNKVTARVGGDEFAILIPNADRIEVEELCNEIRASVDEYNSNEPRTPLSMSVGFSFRSNHSMSMADLFKEADNNMQREKLHRRQSARSAIVQTLMKALEARDFITEGHGERLQDLVAALAMDIGLPKRTETDLRLFAQFHDIGKVGIPDRILFKPGPLTPDEFAEMQRHCEIGHRIALSAPDLAPIADWILKHQEWWNGDGYPLGLKGEDIPVECRILSIVDAFDAMTSDRPYRQAMPIDDAVKELKRCAGTQFDPYLVERFVRIVQVPPPEVTLFDMD
ncbi:MAG: PAS domain S-box protein [Candidatus Saccharibacteria bacterium]